MEILICSILRDSEKFLDIWYSQIANIVKKNEDISFSLSVFENDSSDKTPDKLNSYDYMDFSDFAILSENFGDQKFGSIASEQRVKNLAKYRNKCLSSFDYGLDFDYILFVEGDVTYSNNVFTELLHFSEKYGADICSPASTKDGRFYDGWATRVLPGEKEWQHSRDFRKMGPTLCQSTFNCFCLYRPYFEKPFGWYSEEFKTWDCDTAVICEKYRKEGMSKIFFLPQLEVQTT